MFYIQIDQKHLFLRPNQASDPLNTQSEKRSNNSTTRQQNLLKGRGIESSQDLRKIIGKLHLPPEVWSFLQIFS